MRGIGTAIMAAGAAMALGGCAGAIEAGRMRPVAAAPGSVDPVPITGIGIGRTGGFESASASGRFRRASATSDWFEYRLVAGEAGYIATGPDIRGELFANCRFGRESVAFGEIGRRTIDPLGFDCRFERDHREIAAQLAVGESGGAREGRRGRIDWDGRRIEIRSVHHLANTPLPTTTPVGYAFSVDGQEIGGIDLANRRVAYLPRDPALREAALAAALALAIWWDPGDSDNS